MIAVSITFFVILLNQWILKFHWLLYWWIIYYNLNFKKKFSDNLFYNKKINVIYNSLNQKDAFIKEESMIWFYIINIIILDRNGRKD